MERALWSAVTGMKAQELSLDTIANNMANINTTGFKKSQISFQDMLYSSLSSPGAESGEGPHRHPDRSWHTRLRHLQAILPREHGGDR